MKSIDREIENLRYTIDVFLQSVRNITGERVKNSPSDKLSVISNKNASLKRSYQEEKRIKLRYAHIHKELKEEISGITIPNSIPQKEQEALINQKATLLKKADKLRERISTKKEEDVVPLAKRTKEQAKKESKNKDSELYQQVQELHSQRFIRRLFIASCIGIAVGATYFALDYLKYHWTDKIPGSTSTTTIVTKTDVAATSTETGASVVTSTTSSTAQIPPPSVDNIDTVQTATGGLTEPINVPLPEETVVPTTGSPSTQQSLDVGEIVTESTQDTMLNIAGYNVALPLLYLIAIVAAATILCGGLAYFIQSRRDRSKAKEIVQENAVLNVLQSRIMELENSEDKSLVEKLDGLKETEADLQALSNRINIAVESSLLPPPPPPQIITQKEKDDDLNLEGLISSLVGQHREDRHLQKPIPQELAQKPTTDKLQGISALGTETSEKATKDDEEKKEKFDMEALIASLTESNEKSFVDKTQNKEKETTAELSP